MLIWIAGSPRASRTRTQGNRQRSTPGNDIRGEKKDQWIVGASPTMTVEEASNFKRQKTCLTDTSEQRCVSSKESRGLSSRKGQQSGRSIDTGDKLSDMQAGTDKATRYALIWVFLLGSA